MKRKLIRANKALLSKRFKMEKPFLLQPAETTQSSFTLICAVKLKGQQCYESRIRRQQRMNTRQLKKYRKKQKSLGLTGSKYPGMCKSQLKPAGFWQSIKSTK